MSIRLTITTHLQQVAEEQEVKLPLLSDDLVLLDSGLDSLGFAILVARLEDAVGIDPFTASDDAYFPVTLGDFIAVYENAAKAPCRRFVARSAGSTTRASAFLFAADAEVCLGDLVTGSKSYGGRLAELAGRFRACRDRRSAHDRARAHRARRGGAAAHALPARSVRGTPFLCDRNRESDRWRSS